jgi:hypothetical protein
VNGSFSSKKMREDKPVRLEIPRSPALPNGGKSTHPQSEKALTD